MKNDPFEKDMIELCFEDSAMPLDDNVFKPVAKPEEVPDFPRKPLSTRATTAKVSNKLARTLFAKLTNRESIGNRIRQITR